MLPSLSIHGTKLPFGTASGWMGKLNAGPILVWNWLNGTSIARWNLVRNKEQRWKIKSTCRKELVSAESRVSGLFMVRFFFCVGFG